MARNEVFKDADFVSLPVPVGTNSGDPVRVGGLNAVAQTTEPTALLAGMTPTSVYNEAPSSNKAGYASVALRGAFMLPVTTTTALAVGDPVYITSGNALTPVASGNNLFGHALSVKGTTAGTKVVVRLYN